MKLAYKRSTILPSHKRTGKCTSKKKSRVLRGTLKNQDIMGFNLKLLSFLEGS